MTVDEVADALAAGARLVDVRDGAAFAERHVAGSLNVPLEPSFASYVGWLVPFATPLVAVGPGRRGARGGMPCNCVASGGTRSSATSAAASMRGPRRAGRRSSFPTVRVDELVDELGAGEAGEILDVRQGTEWDAGHLEGSTHVFVGDLPERLDGFDRSERQTVICASGYRSSMAASLLDGAGVPVRLVARSGVPRALRSLASSR